MVSSPNSYNELQFAMRVQGNFTQAVQKLEIGREVRVQGPYGEFCIDPKVDKNVIMMAGGIGITPFISILRYAAEAAITTPLTLLYACSSQDDIPFYDEIIALQTRNPYFRVVFFVGNGLVTPQTGVKIVAGRINQDHLQQLTGGQYKRFTYFICGPDSFRNSLEKTLDKQAVPTDKVFTESFTQMKKVGGIFGYSIPKLTYVLAGLATTGLVAFVMFLDLSRNIPRVAAAATATRANQSVTSTPADTTQTNTVTNPTPSSNTSNASSTSTQSSTSTPVITSPSTNTTQNSAPTSNTTYQAPVSSVS